MYKPGAASKIECINKAESLTAVQNCVEDNCCRWSCSGEDGRICGWSDMGIHFNLFKPHMKTPSWELGALASTTGTIVSHHYAFHNGPATLQRTPEIRVELGGLWSRRAVMGTVLVLSILDSSQVEEFLWMCQNHLIPRPRGHSPHH